MEKLYAPYRKWNIKAPTAEKGIVVGSDLTQEWILPWWWHHYRKFNTYPVSFVDFGMSDDAKKWCQKRGTVIRLPIADIYVAEREEIETSHIQEWEGTFGKHFWIRRNGWFKKPMACLLSPYSQSIWIDLDCEIRSSLQDLFSYAGHFSGVALAKDLHDPRTEKRGYNSGVIVFKYGLPLIETWADQSFELNHAYAGDQDILTKIIQEEAISIAELPPIYNWSRCSGESTEAKIFHWHGEHGKAVIALRGCSSLG